MVVLMTLLAFKKNIVYQRPEYVVSIGTSTHVNNKLTSATIKHQYSLGSITVVCDPLLHAEVREVRMNFETLTLSLKLSSRTSGVAGAHYFFFSIYSRVCATPQIHLKHEHLERVVSLLALFLCYVISNHLRYL